jgi:hypothetical protein
LSLVLVSHLREREREREREYKAKKHNKAIPYLEEFLGGMQQCDIG